MQRTTSAAVIAAVAGVEFAVAERAVDIAVAWVEVEVVMGSSFCLSP